MMRQHTDNHDFSTNVNFKKKKIRAQCCFIPLFLYIDFSETSQHTNIALAIRAPDVSTLGIWDAPIKPLDPRQSPCAKDPVEVSYFSFPSCFSCIGSLDMLVNLFMQYLKREGV